MTTERVVRECGERVAGGIYIVTDLVPAGQGRELEHFIIDPPVPVDTAAMGISDIGQYLIPSQGGEVYHILDVVGQESYPNPCDALEEIRAVGLSRRASPNLDFEKLDHHSRIYLLHRRGLFETTEAWYANGRVLRAAGYRSNAGPQFFPSVLREDDIQTPYCPRWIATGQTHSDGAFCAGLWWENLDLKTPGAEPVFDPAAPYRAYTRQLACGRTYNAARPPDEVKPQYTTAMIASFPISKISVIRDNAGGKHVARAEVARQARGVLVDVEDA